MAVALILAWLRTHSLKHAVDLNDHHAGSPRISPPMRLGACRAVSRQYALSGSGPMRLESCSLAKTSTCPLITLLATVPYLWPLTGPNSQHKPPRIGAYGV